MRKLPAPSSKAKSTKERPGATKGAAPGPGSSSLDTVKYIAEFTAELSFLARQGRHELLAYLLDMARLEAIKTIQSSPE